MPAHFAQKFCVHYGVGPADYCRAALEHALYPHARLLCPVITFFNSEFFAPDRDFVNNVGLLTRRRDFSIEADEFHYQRANRDFLRRWLRLRASATRLQRLVNTLWHADSATGDLTSEEKPSGPRPGSPAARILTPLHGQETVPDHATRTTHRPRNADSSALR